MFAAIKVQRVTVIIVPIVNASLHIHQDINVINISDIYGIECSHYLLAIEFVNYSKMENSHSYAFNDLI